MSLFRQSWPRWILVLTLTSFLGAHWWILQSFTWMVMLGERLAVEPVPMAVTRTFQKQYACKYCKAIEQGREQDTARQTQGALTKSDLNLDMLMPPCLPKTWWTLIPSPFPSLHQLYSGPDLDIASPPPRLS